MSLKDDDHDNGDNDHGDKKEHFLASPPAFQWWRDSVMLVGMSFFLALGTVQIWCQTSPANPAPPGATVMQPVPLTNVAPVTQSNGATTEPPDGQQPGDDQGTAFVFKTEVREVILHATVVDEQRHLVTNLDRLAFTTFEDGAAQKTTAFHRDDVPVAIGIVIDNSGSMREKRDKVNKAVLNLIRASNPEDETFVVNFGQDFYLDQDFTSDIDLLQRALQKVSTQGSTALYDAIVASAVHLKNNTRVERKVLLVITDGRDNASQETLQEAMRQLQQKDGPTLYAIGLLGGEQVQVPLAGRAVRLGDPGPGRAAEDRPPVARRLVPRGAATGPKPEP